MAPNAGFRKAIERYASEQARSEARAAAETFTGSAEMDEAVQPPVIPTRRAHRQMTSVPLDPNGLRLEVLKVKAPL